MNKECILLSDFNFLDEFYYKVQKGDSLSSLADKFHTTESVIIKNNRLSSDVKDGELIFITKIKGEKRVVMPYDSLEKLCDYDKVKIDEVVRKNMIDYLFVGQVIYI